MVEILLFINTNYCPASTHFYYVKSSGNNPNSWRYIYYPGELHRSGVKLLSTWWKGFKRRPEKSFIATIKAEIGPVSNWKVGNHLRLIPLAIYIEGGLMYAAKWWEWGCRSHFFTNPERRFFFVMVFETSFTTWILPLVIVRRWNLNHCLLSYSYKIHSHAVFHFYSKWINFLEL